MMKAKSPSREGKQPASVVSNYALSAIALKIESCLAIMEQISWKQEVFTLNAKSASNGTGKLFHPLVLTFTAQSDMLTIDLLLSSLGTPGTAGGQQQAYNSLLTKNRERKHKIR